MKGEVMRTFREFLLEEDGVGVIEVASGRL